MAAPRVVAAAAVAASSAGSSGGSSGAGLGAAGKAFFGSLCVGTFGLGCWQTSRLLEKQQLMAQRTEELQQTATNQITPGTFRRIQVQGVYDHTRELLVGPRSGPSTAGSTQKGGGTTVAGVSQQGYYVVTPLIVEPDAGADSSSSSASKNAQRVLLVNRGWVPRALVHPTPGRSSQNNSRRNNDSRQAPSSEPLPDALRQWSRPQGITSVLAVSSPVERPRFLVAEHNFRERPIQLYWFDQDTMRKLIDQPDAALLTAIAVDDKEEEGDDTNNSDSGAIASHPLLQPTLESVADFKVTPAVHAAYAVTWFGLSLAGMIMTRKLMRGVPPKLPQTTPSPPRL